MELKKIDFKKTPIKLKNFIYYLMVGFFLIGFEVTASPHPGSGSSQLSNPESGNFLAPLGFIIKTEGTDWTPQSQSDSTIFDSYRLGPKEPKDSDAFLSVRSDKINDKNTNLELYAKKWLRDYPQYGFEFMGTKSIQIQGNNGLIVDFLQRTKNKQVRQVILQKAENLAVFTCTDKKEEFLKTLLICNKIIHSFEWATGNLDSAANIKPVQK